MGTGRDVPRGRRDNPRDGKRRKTHGIFPFAGRGISRANPSEDQSRSTSAHHEIYSNATRLVVLVNTMFWLFVGVVAITWELGVLVVCKEFYKSKQLCKSKHAASPRLDKRNSPSNVKNFSDSPTVVPL
uniref:Uncharacterized protein n=1 Tax=Plectus sambesii TaxID=2011161 RepID=A0A914UVY0_9BILA